MLTHWSYVFPALTHRYQSYSEKNALLPLGAWRQPAKVVQYEEAFLPIQDFLSYRFLNRNHKIWRNGLYIYMRFSFLTQMIHYFELYHLSWIFPFEYFILSKLVKTHPEARLSCQHDSDWPPQCLSVFIGVESDGVKYIYCRQQKDELPSDLYSFYYQIHGLSRTPMIGWYRG